jgi:SHS2 domain-containing protein
MKHQRNDRRLRLLELLAANPDMPIAVAGRAVGYKGRYAAKTLSQVLRNDVDFNRLLEQRKAEIRAQTEDKREKRLREAEETWQNPKVPWSVRYRFWELMCKMDGLVIERQQVEDVTRQRELDAQEREEAQRLARLRFGQKTA